MRPIATDDPVAWCVSQSLWLAAELRKNGWTDKLLFRVDTLADPKHIVLDSDLDLLVDFIFSDFLDFRAFACFNVYPISPTDYQAYFDFLW